MQHWQKRNTLAHNFVMNAILTMSSFIFPLITFPYVSRVLLPVGMGKVAFATSLISYFSMFANLGIPTYGVRACAKVRDNLEELTRTAHELLFINLVMCALSYLILIIMLFSVPRLRSDRVLYLIVSLTIILTAIGMEWLYKALEQYTYITKRSILFKFVALIVMFCGIHEQKDYIFYGGITILAASASNIFNFVNAHKYIGVRFVGNYNIRRHLRPILVFFAMSCATTIYTHMDTIMLGFMATDEDVGYYNAAVKIKIILVSIITSLGTVLLPRSSYYIEHGQIDKLKKVTEKALNFVFIIAMPLMTYFILYARQGILVLSGRTYEYAIIPMQIIMPTLLLIGLTNIFGMQLLVPLGKEKIVLCSEIAGAIANLIVNVLLIPRFSATGAAIGTITAESIVFAVQFYSVKSEVLVMLKTLDYWKMGLGLILGSAVSYGIVLLDLSNILTLVMTICVFWGIYGGCLLITKETFVWELIHQIIKRIKGKFCNFF